LFSIVLIIFGYYSTKTVVFNQHITFSFSTVASTATTTTTITTTR